MTAHPSCCRAWSLSLSRRSALVRGRRTCFSSDLILPRPCACSARNHSHGELAGVHPLRLLAVEFPSSVASPCAFRLFLARTALSPQLAAPGRALCAHAARSRVPMLAVAGSQRRAWDFTARPWVPARRRSSPVAHGSHGAPLPNSWSRSRLAAAAVPTAAHGMLPCARSASSPSSSLRAEVARSSPSLSVFPARPVCAPRSLVVVFCFLVARATFRCPSSCRVLLCTQSRPVSCLPVRPLGSLGFNS